MYRLVVIFMLLCSVSLQAQGFKINPKIGFGSYDFNLEKGSEVDPKLMLTIGSDFRFGNGAFFLNTGLHYSRDAFDNDANTLEEKGSLNFLRIPANVGLYLTGRDGILVIFAKGGITNNIFLSGSGNGAILENFIKNYNMAANIGLGFDVFRFAHIGFDYDIGLTNYFDLDPFVGKKGAFIVSLGLTL